LAELEVAPRQLLQLARSGGRSSLDRWIGCRMSLLTTRRSGYLIDQGSLRRHRKDLLENRAEWKRFALSWIGSSFSGSDKVNEMHPSALEFINLQQATAPTEHVNAELILDTNVSCELYTVADVLQEVNRHGPVIALSKASFQYRAHRTKHSLILAWWLSRQGIPAAFLGAENIDIVVGRLAPDSDPLSFSLTTSFVHIIRDLVFGSWHLGALAAVDHHKLKDAADDEILRIAQQDNTPVITWEAYQADGTFSTDAHKLRNRCRAAGVATYTPEEYLVNAGVDVADEARKFISACDGASWDAHWNRVLDGRRNVDLLVGFYRLILFGEIDRYVRAHYGV
jgi:hypothetical protein